MCHTCFGQQVADARATMEDTRAGAPLPSLPLFAPSDTPRAHLTPLQRVAAVVLCAAGLAAATVAPLVDTTVRTVQRWRKRTAAGAGLESFVDAPRSGNCARRIVDGGEG